MPESPPRPGIWRRGWGGAERNSASLPQLPHLQVEGLGRGSWGFLRCELWRVLWGKGRRGLGRRSQREAGVRLAPLAESTLLRIQNWSVPNPAPRQVPGEPHHSPRAKLLAEPHLPVLPTRSPSCPDQSSAPEGPASALCHLPSCVSPQPLALARLHSVPVNPHPSLRPGLFPSLPASSCPHPELTLFLPSSQPSCDSPVPQPPGPTIFFSIYLFSCIRS